MKFIGIIPARYASTRFPAKPLALLGGKPVIQRVYEQVAGVLDEAYVATDDERIEAVVKAFGGKVVMTSIDHKSGTDSCYEALPRWDRVMMSLSIFRGTNLLSGIRNWRLSSLVLMMPPRKLLL